MKREEIIKKLEQLAITMAEDADDGLVFLPTREIAELLKAAVLELEKKPKRNIYEKGGEKVYIERKQEIAVKAGLSYDEFVKSQLRDEALEEMLRERATSSAKWQMGGGQMDENSVSKAIHEQQGEKYAQKFKAAKEAGIRLGNFHDQPVLYVGDDHAESFRHFLMRLVRDSGNRFVDRGAGNTQWLGMKIFKAVSRQSRVQWLENGAYYWVDPESPGALHRSMSANAGMKALT